MVRASQICTVKNSLLAGAVAAITCFAPVSKATELIANGDFSAFTGGLPTSWTYTQGDGPATLQNAANSPFTNVYPAGTSDLLFTDTASAAAGLTPYILQTFASQSSGTTIYVSWEFNLSSLTANPWVVQVDNSFSAATRFDMDFTGNTFAVETGGGAFAVVTTLTADTWYQVTVALDIGAGTLSGTITPQSGVAVPFSAPWRIPTTTLDRFVFIDLSGNATGGSQNSNIQLDNVSVNTVAPVPEPSVIALALLGFAGVTVVKRRGRK